MAQIYSVQSVPTTRSSVINNGQSGHQFGKLFDSMSLRQEIAFNWLEVKLLLNNVPYEVAYHVPYSRNIYHTRGDNS